MKTYPLQHEANKGKIDDIYDVLKEYRRTAPLVAAIQWRLFFTNGRFDKNHKLPKSLKTNLSARYLQTLQYQVVGMLESHISNIQNKVKEIIYKSNLDDITKVVLFTINKYNFYYKQNPQIKKQPIDSIYIRLARCIFKHIFHKWSKPSYKNINLNLDAKVAKIEKDDGSSTYDYWITVSALQKYQTIDIPLSSNSYFNNKQGDIKNFIQVNEKDDDLEFCLIREDEISTYTPTKGCKVGIDLGLRNLFTTDCGDILGRNFIDQLKYYDIILTRLDAYNRSQGRDVKSKRHNNIVGKIRNLIRHLINECLNKIIELYKPEELVFEKLNFHDCNLSKQMNRLLRNFGLGYLKQRLTDIEQLHKIKIAYVHPSYSSQECHNCHYVDKNNRKTRDLFLCLMCGKRCHADVNGSRIVLHRSSSEIYKDVYKRRDIVLQHVVKGFLERNLYASYNQAQELLQHNPYYVATITQGFM